MVDLDIHGNAMDRNIHGNRPSDIHGNELDRPLVGPPSTGGGDSHGGYDSAGNPVQGGYAGSNAAAGGFWYFTTTRRSLIFFKLSLLSLALGIVAGYFGWQEIPMLGDQIRLFYASGILVGVGLFPAQVGGALILVGVTLIFSGGCTSAGYQLSAIPLGNWLAGIVMMVVGGWVVSRGRS